DDRAGHRLTGEGDAIDVGVRGDQRTRLPEPVDDVVDALGDADVVHDLAEQGGGRGGDLRRLDDHGVAAGERGTGLPRHQQQRQVPRRDDADDATGAAYAVIERTQAVRGVHAERLGGMLAEHIGEGREVGPTPGNVDVAGDRVGLAGVQDLRLEEVVEPPVDAVGDRTDHRGALRLRHLAPRAAEGGTGSCDRGVHLGLAGGVGLGGDLTGDRVQDVERVARLDELAIDEVRQLPNGDFLAHLGTRLLGANYSAAWRRARPGSRRRRPSATWAPHAG